MSSSFDIVNRTKLLEKLHILIDEDELMIIQFLLSNTYLHPKVNNAAEISIIQSNIGTLKGDSLSPVLFIFLS